MRFPFPAYPELKNGLGVGNVRREVRERALAEAAFVLSTGATVRDCAARFGVGKTTAHKDLRRRLPALDPSLARRVEAVLANNLRERHLRGGAATRRKYRGN